MSPYHDCAIKYLSDYFSRIHRSVNAHIQLYSFIKVPNSEYIAIANKFAFKAAKRGANKISNPEKFQLIMR